MKSSKDQYLYKVFDSNNSGKFVVIDYEGKDKVWIQFLKTGFVKTATTRTIASGKVKDPFSPKHFNKGYLGLGNFSKKDKRVYSAWRNMLSRCYSGVYDSYSECEVCDEWLDYQVFAKWYTSQENWNNVKYQLDKDISTDCRGKLYSPEFCKLVPKLQNIAAIRIQSTNKNNGVTGVHIETLKSGKLKFRVTISINDKSTYLGSFDTLEEAQQVYNDRKLSYIESKSN